MRRATNQEILPILAGMTPEGREVLATAVRIQAATRQAATRHTRQSPGGRIPTGYTVATLREALAGLPDDAGVYLEAEGGGGVVEVTEVDRGYVGEHDADYGEHVFRARERDCTAFMRRELGSDGRTVRAILLS